MSNNLDVAKQRLLDKLGPNYNLYIQLLGKWFRGIVSKEEFDKSAKLLIEQSFVIEHNSFWLAFFHHCANNASGPHSAHTFPFDSSFGDHQRRPYNDSTKADHIDQRPSRTILNDTSKVRCLPNKVMTHMKTFVIAWEMGLDSANDQVSHYINLALQHFLKNIITELICAKTAYRLRENKFKYAIGVKPINPYLNNSLRIYANNLEYDPYQIESNKMNSSLLDTCLYNDTLFPSRLYEAQALYEYACSTTSISRSRQDRPTKRLKLSDIFINHDDNSSDLTTNQAQDGTEHSSQPAYEHLAVQDNCRLTPLHLLIAFLTNRTVLPARSLYSINLERIFNKLST